ncbi:hypothetical protein MASR2M70_08500 [Bacillota bacterium]
MAEWWSQLDIVLKILYCMAIPATLIFIIQTVLSLLGGFEGGPGMDFSDTSGLDFDGGSNIGEISDAADMGDPGHLGDGGHPSDFSIMSMFSLQGIGTFLMVMGWTSIAAISAAHPPLLSILLGILFGFAAMFAVAKLIHASRRLTENGTLNLKNAIGATARVYVPIPAGGTGEGKVTLNLQGRFIEGAAIYLGEKPLATGTVVRVTDLRSDIFVVEEDL